MLMKRAFEEPLDKLCFGTRSMNSSIRRNSESDLRRSPKRKSKSLPDISVMFLPAKRFSISAVSFAASSTGSRGGENAPWREIRFLAVGPMEPNCQLAGQLEARQR